MNTRKNQKPPQSSSDQNISVPRDLRPGDDKRDNPPEAGSRNFADEDYAVADQPVLPDTPTERVLHAHPPEGKDQLTVGSGGDGARPGKDGIFGKPIPPRGSL